jgi:hypothetical protein
MAAASASAAGALILCTRPIPARKSPALLIKDDGASSTLAIVAPSGASATIAVQPPPEETYLENSVSVAMSPAAGVSVAILSGSSAGTLKITGARTEVTVHDAGFTVADGVTLMTDRASGAADLAITASSINLNGIISTPAASMVEIQPDTDVAITLGGTTQSQGFGLTSPEIKNIHGGRLIIGKTEFVAGMSGAGSVDLSQSGPAELCLRTGGDFSLAGCDLSLGATALSVVAGGHLAVGVTVGRSKDNAAIYYFPDGFDTGQHPVKESVAPEITT